jgi:predicted deacylase
MKRDLLLMTAPVRDSFDIPYHEIGPASQHPAAAFVAGMHGDELNGIYVLSRLANFLEGVEKGQHAGVRLKRKVLIIPAVNVLGVNLRSRTWPFDKSDVNRMFPGSVSGETTQRIALAVLEATKKAEFRVDLHTAGCDFEELPQVRLYNPTDEQRRTAQMFGLPAIMERSSSPVFTTTLMHAWQVWPGQSFLLRIGQGGTIQLGHCQQVFRGLLAFLGKAGILEGVSLYEPDNEVHCFRQGNARRSYAPRAGMFVSDSAVGKWVRAGQELMMERFL